MIYPISVWKTSFSKKELIDTGQLAFKWDNSKGFILQENLLHYQVCFEVVDGDCLNSELEFVSFPQPIKVTSRLDEPINFWGRKGIFTSDCKPYERSFFDIPDQGFFQSNNEHTDLIGKTRYFPIPNKQTKFI